MEYRVMLQRENGHYLATVPAIPGLKRTGRTKESTIAVMQDAIEEFLSSVEWVTIDVPAPTNEYVQIEPDNEPSDELLALIEEIKSTPRSPSVYTYPTRQVTPEWLVELRKPLDPDPDFDEAVWNARWATMEAEMNREEEEDERAYLSEMGNLYS